MRAADVKRVMIRHPMANISVEELDLLGFFSVEPTRLDADVPWPYNNFSYAVQQGGLSLTVALAPAYKDVRIILTSGSDAIYELKALGVEDVKYHKDGIRETLEIVLTARDRLWLRVWPSISVSHQVIEDV
jgi:hypothetical protein